MRSTRTVLAALLSLPVLASAAPLAPMSAADVRELSSGLRPPDPEPVFVESELTEAPAAAAARAAAPAAQPAYVESVAPLRGQDPVIITVPGLKFGEIGWGPLEIRNLLKLVKFFRRGKDVTEADLVDGFVSFNPRYFLSNEEDGLSAEACDPDKLDDNYLEKKLREIPGYENHNVIVMPFAWSRDPGDTRRTLPLLQARIAEVYDAFKGSGRPIYILAHSWGSVLAHTALHRVARARPDVRIDKLITAGSPLVPSNPVVKLFVRFETRRGRLEKRVSKPANVAVWRNYWARRDPYSNSIQAADSNFQADGGVENLEPTLIDIILHKKPLRKEARQDLFKMRDIKAWHGAYFFDYRATLKSIAKEIDVEVFRPALAPQVVDCSQDPQARMCRP